MIEINLLAPGSGATATRRSPLAFLARFRKPADADLGDEMAMPEARRGLVLAAAASVAIVTMAVGGGWWWQGRTAQELDAKLQSELADSARFSAVIGEQRTVIAKRDSVIAQLAVIRDIDDTRYVWAHVLDEVSRQLPPYTWLTSVQQTAWVAPVPQRDTTRAAAGDSTRKKKDAPRAEPMMAFQVVGNTADIQALTRYMRDLEGSPFVQNVTLNKSAVVVIDNREVTEFTLDAQYQKPDPSAITTAPVTLSVR
ncbi:MAG: PilN domain-containing protein [Gemmatimonadaceae bacterium]|jgi:Tfp pilus assembly protein PilN|nr:PilN domain-containing protein [Gemmatimonadaceae bacterium]